MRGLGATVRLEVADLFRSVLREILAGACSAGADLARMRAALERRQHELIDPVQRMALRAVVCGMLEDAEQARVMPKPPAQEPARPAAPLLSLMSRIVQAETDALLDPLTRVANRRAFDRAVQALQYRRASLAGCAVLFVDLDHFKRINDRHGHDIGDRVLRGVADRLRANISADDMIARFGGEEFVVLLTDITPDGAHAVAERLRSAIAREAIDLGAGSQLNVTLSIGIAMAGEREGIEALISRADAAMYRAKRSGRDRMTWASSPAPRCAD
jgi:diguanylate cyclase (GGDEF)-like protein